MADANDLYKDDLYGDLDLEDLDATQLEELVEPPELEPAPSSSSAQPQASTSTPAIAPLAQQQTNDFGGQTSQQPAFNAGGGDITPEQALDRIRPSDMPDEGKMFIGGLNWETTDDGLKAYMAQFGEIEACTIMRDLTGRSRGFAFLTYKASNSVDKVLQKTHTLDGKQIDPKRAIPRAEHERTAKVFVGGLAPSVTGESLRSFLTQFGPVMDATVMFDKETTRSKGFAFATFGDEDSVQRAMENSGIELEGKPIEIKRAQPRGAGTQPGKFGSGNNNNNGQNSQSRNNQFGNNNQFNGMNNNMGSGFNGPSGAGGGGGGFDPNAMAMMYQNMMKNNGMG
nr:RNA-binding protein Musashi [Kwoniella pini CBS 10737]OCF47703.1 RNA-binding protein Musashi [Kwoniella pini CBS 10737]